MGPARFLMAVFSLCLHGGVAGALFFFSAGHAAMEEKVYQVSLAEFAAPAQAEAPAAAPSPPPEPEAAPPPEPPSAPPAPPSEPVKEPEAKVISTKKTNEPPKRPQAKPKPAAPQPQAAAQPSGTAGPQPGQVGGFSAYKADQVDQRPSITRRIAPSYPSKARRMNMEGKVTVRMVVDADGLPQACAVHSADPPGWFEDSALEAARGMRFIPGKVKGVPVNTVVLLPFAFQLR